MKNDLKKIYYIKMATLADLQQIAKQNKIKVHVNKSRLIELLKEKDLMPEEKELDPKREMLLQIRTNPKYVILKNITTNEELSFPSVYKASKFLGKSPRMITYYNGRIWNNQYEIKMKDPPTPNNNKCYPRKTLKTTIKKIREYCMKEHGFDPMLYI